MSDRIKKKQDSRRRELLEVALKLFMEVGYEKASIRLLATRAGGDIGLIYHYFSSKSEIYEAALTYYNDRFVTKITEIFQDPNIVFKDKIDKLFAETDLSLREYRPLVAEENREIALILHANSLQSLSPVLDDLIKSYLDEKGVSIDDSYRIFFSNFLLYGCSGVIHATGQQSLQQRLSAAQQIIFNMLDTVEGVQA